MELALSLEQLSPSLLVLLSLIFIFVAVFLFGVIFILEIIFSLAVVFEFFCCLPLWWHLHFWDCLYFWGHFLWSSLHFLVVINVEATLIFEVIFIFMVQYNNNIKFWTEYKYKYISFKKISPNTNIEYIHSQTAYWIPDIQNRLFLSGNRILAYKCPDNLF